jgi:hypothetical protein
MQAVDNLWAVDLDGPALNQRNRGKEKKFDKLRYIGRIIHA